MLRRDHPPDVALAVTASHPPRRARLDYRAAGLRKASRQGIPISTRLVMRTVSCDRRATSQRDGLAIDHQSRAASSAQRPHGHRPRGVPAPGVERRLVDVGSAVGQQHAVAPEAGAEPQLIPAPPLRRSDSKYDAFVDGQPLRPRRADREEAARACAPYYRM